MRKKILALTLCLTFLVACDRKEEREIKSGLSILRGEITLEAVPDEIKENLPKEVNNHSVVHVWLDTKIQTKVKIRYVFEYTNPEGAIAEYSIELNRRHNQAGDDNSE